MITLVKREQQPTHTRHHAFSLLSTHPLPHSFPAIRSTQPADATRRRSHARSYTHSLYLFWPFFLYLYIYSCVFLLPLTSPLLFHCSQTLSASLASPTESSTKRCRSHPQRRRRRCSALVALPSAFPRPCPSLSPRSAGSCLCPRPQHPQHTRGIAPLHCRQLLVLSRKAPS